MPVSPKQVNHLNEVYFHQSAPNDTVMNVDILSCQCRAQNIFEQDTFYLKAVQNHGLMHQLGVDRISK